MLIAAIIQLWFQASRVGELGAPCAAALLPPSPAALAPAPANPGSPTPCTRHAPPPCPARQIKWATFIGLGILLLTTPASAIFMKKVTG